MTEEWRPENVQTLAIGSSISASETSGTEGWLRSACAAEARSALKPTREGVDSGGNGPGMLYLESPPLPS